MCEANLHFNMSQFEGVMALPFKDRVVQIYISIWVNSKGHPCRNLFQDLIHIYISIWVNSKVKLDLKMMIKKSKFTFQYESIRRLPLPSFHRKCQTNLHFNMSQFEGNSAVSGTNSLLKFTFQYESIRRFP